MPYALSPVPCAFFSPRGPTTTAPGLGRAGFRAAPKIKGTVLVPREQPISGAIAMAHPKSNDMSILEGLCPVTRGPLPPARL